MNEETSADSGSEPFPNPSELDDLLAGEAEQLLGALLQEQSHQARPSHLLGYGALIGGSVTAIGLLATLASDRNAFVGKLIGAGALAAAGVGLNYAARELTGKDLVTLIQEQIDIEQGNRFSHGQERTGGESASSSETDVAGGHLRADEDFPI